MVPKTYRFRVSANDKLGVIRQGTGFLCLDRDNPSSQPGESSRGVGNQVESSSG